MATPIQRLNSVQEKYGFITQIGKGTYGDIWVVVPLDSIAKGKRYVLKRLDLRSTTDDIQQVVEREAKLLSTLKHPNIIKYIESFRSWDSYLNIVMYYCQGGDLHTAIREKRSGDQMFEEAKVIEWCVQICMALEYLHERHIIHRDVKTQNIFLTEFEIIKLGDFGISKVLDGADDLATTIVGTPYYMSPELYSNKPYDQKSDIWSLGCCMYELVTLNLAFKAADINSLVLKIIRGNTPGIRGNYSDELKKIIRSMLSKEPHDRPTAQAVLKNKYIRHHIVRLLGDFKERVQNTKQSKRRRKLNISLLTLEPDTKSMTDSCLSESRTCRRQKNAAQQQSASHITVQPTTALAINANDLLSNRDESEVPERCPVEKLTSYFEEQEEEDEEDPRHIQIKNEFTNTLYSSPDSKTFNVRQEPTTTMARRRTSAANVKAPVEDHIQMKYRYSDIGTLPDQTLLPITGYNKKPLTSLEDSVRSVRHLLDGIDVKMIVAKENAQKRHGILSVEESASIQLYTMEAIPYDRSLYYILNATLRSANRRDLIPWFPYLKLLMTALWKLPAVRRIVWRGIKHVDLSKQYQQGQRYTWWNLSSCTDLLTVMETSPFLGTDGLRTLFSIECENGKEIKEYSYLGNENEVLLPPATYFEVLGKASLAPDLYIIQVRQITPPYELISPPFQ